MPPTAPPTEPARPANLAESLLALLRDIYSAEGLDLIDQNGAYTDVREALIKVLHSVSWPRYMAEEAIDRAINEPSTIRAAMYATQIGIPTRDAAEQLR